MIFGEFQWVELVYGFFGSFVGFLLALLTDNYIQKREERSKIATVLEAIESELRSTAALLSEGGDDDDGLMFFSTFVWDSVTASDFFPTLLHEENEKCSLLIKVYSGFDTIKGVQEKYPDLTQEINFIKKQILEAIDEFCRLMDASQMKKRKRSCK